MVAVPINYISVDARGVAYVSGSRIQVMHLAQAKNAWGLTLEEIQQVHTPLSLAQIYAAFAYYYDHKAEVDAQIEASAQSAETMRAEADAQTPAWKYLAPRPESWKRQLYVMGRRLTAANVWYDMLANRMTPQEVAADWDLPLEAVEEIIRYCAENHELIAMEADEEKRFLEENGISLTPGTGA